MAIVKGAATVAAGTDDEIPVTHEQDTGTGRFLLIDVMLRDPAEAVTGVTVEGDAATFIQQRDGTNCRVERWKFLDPPEGEIEVIVTKGGTVGRAIVAVRSYLGVHQADPVVAGSESSGSGTAPAVTVSGSTSTFDLIVDAVAVQGDTGLDGSPDGSQDEDFAQLEDAGADGVFGGGSTLPGTGGSVNMAWTMNASREWAILATALRASIVLVEWESTISVTGSARAKGRDVEAHRAATATAVAIAQLGSRIR